jgi:carbonic anhydrase
MLSLLCTQNQIANRASTDYVLCQAGTQQAPIPLLTTQGFADTHIPKFDEESYMAVPGKMFNWG